MVHCVPSVFLRLSPRMPPFELPNASKLDQCMTLNRLKKLNEDKTQLIWQLAYCDATQTVYVSC